MVAEGDLFAIDQSFDAAGLLGDVSAEIRWGDGTTTPASTVNGGNPVGNLSIRFDYSLDTNQFFGGANQSRRDLLQIAADSLVKRFGDSLSAITPTNLHQWQVSIFHPSIGPSNQIEGTLTPLTPNLPIAENEIVIYAGARDLPGNTAGVAGPAASSSTSLPPVQCQTKAECDQIEADFEAFQDLVRGRGQPGALESPATDFAPHFGSISFDSDTDFYFDQAEGIQPAQIDFLSVAMHELAHVLGFGTSASWTRLSHGGTYTGPAANAAYLGGPNVPLAGDHWALSVRSVQSTLMAPSLDFGAEQLFSPLDFAAMADIGWQLLDTQTTVTAEQRYVDNGDFVPEVVLRAASHGELVFPLDSVNVTNVAPALTVPDPQTVFVGQTLSLTDIGVISDPGSSNNAATPATTETFTYQIDWGDASPVDSGNASIDQLGDRSGGLTMASFDGSHIYASAGTYSVTVSVVDDDGGSVDQTFNVVASEPAIEIVVSPTGPGGAADPPDLPSGQQPTSWAQQRSDIRQVVVNLIDPVATVVADDLLLTNLGVDVEADPDVVVPILDEQISLSGDGLRVTIGFAAGQLQDGVYQLQLQSALTGSAPVVITGDDQNRFFVLTGDWNGSGGVNIQDFATFAYWFATNQAPAYVDLNNSGGINIQDFSGFATNFGKGINFTSSSLSAGAEITAENELPADQQGEGELLQAMRTPAGTTSAVDMPLADTLPLAGRAASTNRRLGTDAVITTHPNDCPQPKPRREAPSNRPVESDKTSFLTDGSQDMTSAPSFDRVTMRQQALASAGKSAKTSMQIRKPASVAVLRPEVEPERVSSLPPADEDSQAFDGSRFDLEDVIRLLSHDRLH